MASQRITAQTFLSELPPGAACQPQSVTSRQTGTRSESASWSGEQTRIDRLSAWYRTCHSPAIECAMSDNTYSS
jgi:hypothetical protein